jgi:hypothetical protein
MLSENESMACKVELGAEPERLYLQMRRPCTWLLLACLVTSVASGAPAVWAPHELIVDLHELPRHYTCDELWYKFKGILQTLGARQDMEILPYRCEGYSPQVQLKFSTPRVVTGANARWSELTAITRTVQIAPGSPDKLDSSDCELMAQIKSSLLTYLGSPIVSYRLPCQQPREAGQPAFAVTLKVLVPVPASVASR